MFLAAFWPYSGKEPKNAAEQRKQPAASFKLANTKRPALFLLWRHTRGAFDMDETGGGRPAKETTANLQNANGAPAVPISQKMKRGAKVTRYRQRAKGKGRFSYC